MAKICLVLGCHKNVDGEFTYCYGVSNPILDLSMLDDNQIDLVIDFLNESCNIVDSPIVDNNKVVNVISYLYKTYNAFDKDTLYKVQFFIKMHKPCGLKLELIILED